MADFLNHGGTVPPIHVKMIKGKWKLLDGRHRLTAFRLLERTSILVKFGDVN